MQTEYQMVVGQSIPFGHLSFGHKTPLIWAMDDQEIRRRNLLALIEEKYGGVRARLASAMKKEASSINRLFWENENRRSIGEKLAREIERVAGVEPRWLDRPPEIQRTLDIAGPTPEKRGIRVNGRRVEISDEAAQIMVLFNNLSGASQKILLGNAEKLYGIENPGKSIVKPYGDLVVPKTKSAKAKETK